MFLEVTSPNSSPAFAYTTRFSKSMIHLLFIVKSAKSREKTKMHKL